MVDTTTRPLTLDDYLALEQNPDRPAYELDHGIIHEMPPESELNRRIATLLFAYFLQRGISFERLSLKTEIIVTSHLVTARIPDLILLSEELTIALEQAPASVITNDLPRPDLVVEIVSPGKENRDRDYRYKRTEYAACRIPEYWIIDPERGSVSVLEWVDGFYDVVEFVGDAAIVSPKFGTLDLLVEDLVNARRR